MKIPQTRDKLLPFCQEIIEQCETSRKDRVSAAATWTKWFRVGSAQEVPETYNKIGPHVDAVSTSLYSPIDVQFSIEFDRSAGDDVTKMGDIGASILSRDFHRRGCDTAFGQA